MMRILYYFVRIYLFDAHIKNTLCEDYIILCTQNMYLLCTLNLFVLLVLFGAHFIFIWQADFIMKLMKDP